MDVAVCQHINASRPHNQRDSNTGKTNGARKVGHDNIEQVNGIEIGFIFARIKAVNPISAVRHRPTCVVITICRSYIS